MRTHESVRRAKGSRGASAARGGSRLASREDAGTRIDQAVRRRHRRPASGSFVVLAAVLGALCVTPAAADSACLTVTTTPVDFGQIYTGATFTGIGTVRVTAPSGLHVTVALGSGFHYSGGFRHLKRTDGADLIPYNLYSDAGCTLALGDAGLGDTYPAGSSVAATGIGRDQVITIYGRLTVPAQAHPGQYLDSIVVTVLY